MQQALFPLHQKPLGQLTLLSLLAIGIFAWLFPTHVLIADEVAYFEQGFAWAQGNTLLRQAVAPCDSTLVDQPVSDYPAGNSLVLAGWVAAFGPKSVFWHGLLSWLLGCWALGLALWRQGKSIVWLLLPAVFVPGLLLTRTVMSDTPSFALAGLFLLFFTAPARQKAGSLGAGFLGGLSLLFRETNLLWLGPFLLGALWRQERHGAWLWLGFGLGLGLRLLSAQLFLGDPFFVRDPGIGFSIGFFFKNIGLYGLALLILLPGGLWWVWTTKWRYRQEALAATALFLLVLGCYGYDALAKSGYKAVLLQGRFLLPLVPVCTFAAAFGVSGWHELVDKNKRLILVGAVLLFLLVQLLGHWYNRAQQQFTSALYALPRHAHVSFSPDDTKKFINDLYGSLPVFSADAVGRQQLQCESVWYAHLISRNESQDRQSKAEAAVSAWETWMGPAQPDLIQDLRLPDGTRLRLWRGSGNPENAENQHPTE
ncbi:MAG: hypothetical protein IT260_07395 [Saprospiraceae bacterium]|nr:hypothetical protein [Saprospiraceae bacterium]